MQNDTEVECRQVLYVLRKNGYLFGPLIEKVLACVKYFKCVISFTPQKML